MLSDFIKAWNQAQNVDLYERENEAIDHPGTLWRALEATATWAGRELLDLGCGNGFWLPKYAPAARRLYGVEPDESLLETARGRTPAAQVLYGSAERIPLPDASIDVVHARFAYFFPTPDIDCTPGLSEVLRVLRPGGSLVVIDNDQDHGEFAELLTAGNTAGHQGSGEFIREWWADQGASTERIMSSWTFESPTDLQEVIIMEFPNGAARNWLAAHPDRTHISYGYLLHRLIKDDASIGGSAAP